MKEELKQIAGLLIAVAVMVGLAMPWPGEEPRPYEPSTTWVVTK